MKRFVGQFAVLCSSIAVTSLSAHADQPPATIPVPPGAVVQANASGAKIQFETPIYDFGKGKAGDPVKHTFIFTNIGTEPLDIKAVRPGCGCTTAGDWTKQVAPGGTGTIPIQVNVAATWPNGPIVKTVSVDSNDKSQPTATLQIKGNVWKPVEVNPQLAYLNVPPDAANGASSVIRIVNNTEEPMKLSDPESNNKSFVPELKTVQDGKEYQLIVKAVPPFTPGNNIQGMITVKTSLASTPVVTVQAMAFVQPAVTISPQQITLPGGPLASRTGPTITINNNSTNALKLSEPIVNSKDVEVQIAEPQPGKIFTATINFPQGYEMPQGQPVEFTVKSNNPQHPVIKVPIIQMPRPVTPIVPIRASVPPPVHAPQQ